MLSIGVDIVEIQRIRRLVRRFDTGFLKQVYRLSEVEQCSADPTRFASAFAGKEAVAKALGAGFAHITSDGLLPTDIEIVPLRWSDLTNCRVQLHAAAHDRAFDLDLSWWTVQLIRNGRYAIAAAVAASCDVPPESVNAALVAISNDVLRLPLSRIPHQKEINHEKVSLSANVG
jgi:phosphopantetheine--protein transferase-like protein